MEAVSIMAGMNKSTGPSGEIILSRRQVRDCDRVAIERFGINGLVLMENAGSAAAWHIISLLEAPAATKVCVIAGTGNNAGDGFVAARHLSSAGVAVNVLICGSRERIKGDALSNLRIIENMSLPIEYIGPSCEDVTEIVKEYAGSADVIVDAMLGTGAAGPPREPIGSVIEEVNKLQAMVVALDIPSGLDCDSGEPMEPAIKADHTITFVAMKKGFVGGQASRYTGQITVASIGIRSDLLLQ
jgi:NAD(P)H-hydrate epimerase